MQRDVILIFGQTGSGKSTKARQILAGVARALVADAGFGEFPARYFTDFDSLILHLEAIRAYSRYETGEISYVPFRVAYNPLMVEYPLLFDLSRECGNVHLFLEEADRFDDPRECPEYDEFITRGRHFGLSIVAVGLHFYKLPKELRRQATCVYSFKQIDAGDIDALAEVVGPCAYRLGPNEQGRFSIPDFAYLHWTPQTGSKIIGPDGKIISPQGPEVVSPPHNPPQENLGPKTYPEVEPET